MARKATHPYSRYQGASNSSLRLLRRLQGIIDLDTKITHSAFELGVSQQQLDDTQIIRALVDQLGLGGRSEWVP